MQNSRTLIALSTLVIASFILAAFAAWSSNQVARQLSVQTEITNALINDGELLETKLIAAQNLVDDQGESLSIYATVDQLSEILEITSTLEERMIALESSAQDQFRARVREAIMADPVMLFDAVDTYEKSQVSEQFSIYSDLIQSDPYIPVLGNPNGDITLVEYFDYNCGYCRRALADVLSIVESDGGIRLIMKEFPILSQDSQDAAVVAMAAAEFVPYLDLHRAAMTSSGRVSGSSMLTLAVELGADLDQLQARIAEEQESILSSLNNTQTAARALGVSGTPAFFIEDTLIPGAVGQGELSEVIADIRAARN